MNVRCPQCQVVFRVDPSRIPAAGVRAKCSRCGGVFPITPPTPAATAAPDSDQASGAPQGGGAGPAGGGRPFFRARDPHARARRLARALVSDIVAYHPDRVDESLQGGNLRSDFRDEILKSWEEYVAQVGLGLAKDTPYFRQALNQILARGQRVF